LKNDNEDFKKGMADMFGDWPVTNEIFRNSVKIAAFNLNTTQIDRVGTFKTFDHFDQSETIVSQSTGVMDRKGYGPLTINKSDREWLYTRKQGSKEEEWG